MGSQGRNHSTQVQGSLEKQWNADTLERWKNKPLHGQYPKQVSDLTDDLHAYKWMKTTGLKVETEALIIAAQEQALNTKSHQARI